MLQGWFQKFLVQQSNTSPTSDNDDDVSSGQAEVLPSTEAVTTFCENGRTPLDGCYVYAFMLFMYVSVVAVVTTESSTTGDGYSQQDGGDIGASVIDHLPAGVSAQCEFAICICI